MVVEVKGARGSKNGGQCITKRIYIHMPIESMNGQTHEDLHI